MKFNSFLAIAYAFVITSFSLIAGGMPESIPLTPVALRAYANSMARHGEVDVWGTLVSENDDSLRAFDIEPGVGAEGILKAIGDADVTFGVVDPSLKVNLGIYIYDGDWNQLYRYSARKAVQKVKGGGYELVDLTYQLVLQEIWIEIGQEVRSAQLMFTNRFGAIENVVDLESEEGDTGFYIYENQLVGGAYLRLYIGDNWDEYFYSPDGKLVTPVQGEVHSLSGSIEGVTIVKGEWTQQVIQTYKGYGRNMTYEFHPSETDFYYLPIVTSEGYAPVTINVMYPNGEIQKFPAIVNGAWNQIGLQGGGVYQIFFDWGDALIEDNGKG